MTEMLRNARQGWLGMTDCGKVMALFLAALLFLWLYHRKERQKGLLLYTTVMAVCCIIPFTAFILMLYQTKFYDYEWIWSMVPVTAVTAYGGTVLLADSWQDFRRSAWRKGLPVTLGLLLIALLCSGPWDSVLWRENRVERSRTAEVLEYLTDGEKGQELCLWAPREIMEYARSTDSSIRLPYGRNMWDITLNGYSYDQYSEAVTDMYRWMCLAEGTGETKEEEQQGESPSAVACLDTALALGVNCILLPDNAEQVLLNEVEGLLQMQPEQISGYYVFRTE